MIDSEPILTQWIEITGRVPTPIPEDHLGRISLDFLRKGTAALTAWQSDSLIAMGGFLCTDSKLSVSIPDNSLDRQPASTRIADDPWRLIVRHARDCAARLHVNQLEILIPDEDYPGIPHLCRSLTRSGFTRQARISHWKRLPTRPSSLTVPAPQIHSLTAEILQHQTGYREELASLLQQVLQNSSDLTNIDSPNPTDLIAEWIEDQATLLVDYNTHGTPLGLCCCISRQANKRYGIPNSVEIRYLGVHPEHRRRGIGHRLVNAAVHFAFTGKITQPPPNISLNNRNPRQPHKATEINICVDEDNLPAISLYQKNGFVRDRKLQLWNDTKTESDSGRRLANQL
ncbi:MAG: Acetyltransferase family [Planctomycetota bacterium]|jgi:ribosomal protein S18 acetylase RimI-like enzyme